MAVEPPVPPQLGNYDIVSKIAEGGMGTVYKAKNRTTGEIVAVKVIAPATAKNPILLQRFEREFLAAKVLDHPNVVKAIDYSGALPHPFLVMEFVDGLSIGQRIEKQGAYPEAEAVRLIAQVCDGLQRAHKQGLVHRDVKPDNILVNKDGVAKLTDMGLVKEVEGDLNLTRTGRGLGTPHFMAPEQFRNAKTVDVRGDIYSLGATLYAMVTGVVPFENASPLDCWMRKIRNEFRAPKDLKPAISDRVDWAIRRAMSAEPSQRPSSCREFLEDLTGQSRSATTAGSPNAQVSAPAVDVWYLVYRDENDKAHTVKGSTDGIRNALRDSLLGDPSGVLVSRTKNGQFSPLSSVPEFRDLVVTPAALAMPATRTPGSDETTDYGASLPTGSSSSASRLRAGGSGPRPSTPVPSTSPSKPSSPLPTQPSSGTYNATTPYSYSGASGAHAAHEPREPRETNKPKPARPRPENREESFNWTPVLLAVVMALSAVIGYLILK
ncbi:serine threonine protein kinase : Putative serine/threonine protein kinase OS=Gemmata sp. Wa1-1 PE=4 SV=1: Pkinase [Gemmata massiliana]|uniref:Protein kinase domain-containing protein n=1 Tax=Gemmata massiliana TaxID=1210884 RepID=A0A6P2CPS5_9BACT|nr:serine/threonine-protein kinase [Gemmata massiliana]VTR91018.1 serine threonine protein kinase : Putative serine/threonine protein kinase OS=Gemmata sp. Wa1-1 PE=4 SV=1: Pkinase [Gemmata massiliana]